MCVDKKANAVDTGSGQSSKKRKADVLGRLEQSKFAQGRGSLSGWTGCPLCGCHSRKRYALGRGIAAHLHAVHTPWNPGKAELRKRRRRLQEQARQRVAQQQKQHETDSIDNDETSPVDGGTCRDPTPEEKEEWDQQVLEITADLEAKSLETTQSSNPSSDNLIKEAVYLAKGHDRNGQLSRSYRKSLPPFVQAAADGNLEMLRQFVDEVRNASSSQSQAIMSLVDTRDRNNSTAEHWAAGNNLTCLKFLLELRKQHANEKEISELLHKKIRRRRDGKTSLHYASRNGRLECIKYLLLQAGVNVNEQSGDGTTPLHMACYGGHVDAVQLLLQHGANVHATNEWGCGAGHWIAMTTRACEESADAVRQLCNLLWHKLGVSFTLPQKQGHSALHKAAQRRNRHVIEWMAQSTSEGGAGLSREECKVAGQPDEGGHKPSDIWRSVGGEESFANWMANEHGW